LERNGRGIIEVISQYLLEELRKITKNITKLTGVPGGIRIEHFPNTSPESYRYTDLIGSYRVTHALKSVLNIFHVDLFI
jgi:hypothetical protein